MFRKRRRRLSTEGTIGMKLSDILIPPKSEEKNPGQQNFYNYELVCLNVSEGESHGVDESKVSEYLSADFLGGVCRINCV
jgi:hypothetical protein